MELTDINLIRSLLKEHGFNLSKGLGQNFLINPDICPKMAELCGADENTAVLEIGPGIGVLTKELAKVAKKVVSVEVDTRLIPVLGKTLAEFDNVTIIEGDILSISLDELFKEHFKNMRVVVCANIPYYITTPIVMKLLESRIPVESVTVMIQKETAERFCAEIGSRGCGAITVSAGYYASSHMLFEVDRNSYFPAPNVDSAVIKMDVYKEPPVSVINEKDLFKVIKSAFSQRRKTIYNSISSGASISKSKLAEILESCNIPQNARAEQLRLTDFAAIANELSKSETV